MTRFVDNSAIAGKVTAVGMDTSGKFSAGGINAAVNHPQYNPGTRCACIIGGQCTMLLRTVRTSKFCGVIGPGCWGWAGWRCWRWGRRWSRSRRRGWSRRRSGARRCRSRSWIGYRWRGWSGGWPRTATTARRQGHQRDQTDPRKIFPIGSYANSQEQNSPISTSSTEHIL